MSLDVCIGWGSFHSLCVCVCTHVGDISASGSVYQSLAPSRLVRMSRRGERCRPLQSLNPEPRETDLRPLTSDVVACELWAHLLCASFVKSCLWKVYSQQWNPVSKVWRLTLGSSIYYKIFNDLLAGVHREMKICYSYQQQYFKQQFSCPGSCTTDNNKL